MKGEQLPLFGIDSDSQSVSLSTTDSERKRAAIQRYLDSGERDPEFSVNTYSPGRRKAQYYRLSYRQRRKMKHIHIPGGSTRSALARYRAKVLGEMIERGAKLEEVIAAVETFRSGQI